MKGRVAYTALLVLALAGFGSCCQNVLAAWGPKSNYTIFDAMLYRAGNLTNSMPFGLDAKETPDNSGYSHYITVFAPDDRAMVNFLNALKLTIHSYLTMDQQWLRTILYTHAVPAVNLPFKVGDVYPTFNPNQNITVGPGRYPGEVSLSTSLTFGYVNTTDPRMNTCQMQWYTLDGILLPPVNARMQLNTEPAADAVAATLGSLGVAGRR